MKERSHKVERDVYDTLMGIDYAKRTSGLPGVDPSRLNKALRKVIESTPNFTEDQRQDALKAMDRIESIPEDPAPPITGKW